MVKALKIFGGLIGVLLLIVLVLVAMNWTMLNNIRLTKNAGVRDVQLFQPRVAVKGCDQGPLARYAAEDTPLPADTFAEMKAYSDSHGGVGLMVLVNGKIAGEAYNDADETTRTLSYSMHKSVMALAYGAAVEDGIIKSIDDPINSYLSEWAYDDRGKIPLRAFLTMSSGLDTPGFGTLAGLNLNLSDKVTKTATSLQQIKPAFEQFYYKGQDSQVAGAALNRALKAAGKGSYAAYMSEKIWCPLGAQDALLWPETEDGDPRFYAYFDAALHDWARVGLMIENYGKFNGQQILPASWIKAIATASATNPNYGLQTWLGSPYLAQRKYAPDRAGMVPQAEPFLAEGVIYFDGFGGQRVYVVRDANMVIVRTGEPSWAWDESTLVNLAIRGMSSAQSASSQPGR